MMRNRITHTFGGQGWVFQLMIRQLFILAKTSIHTALEQDAGLLKLVSTITQSRIKSGRKVAHADMPSSCSPSKFITTSILERNKKELRTVH